MTKITDYVVERQAANGVWTPLAANTSLVWAKRDAAHYRPMWPAAAFRIIAWPSGEAVWTRAGGV